MGTTGTPAEASPSAARGLTTVLFTDIESSTERAAQLGDRRWRALLDAHEALCRRLVEEHDGRVLEETGDGALALFASPGRGVACALALVQAAEQQLGVALGAGVHTGEVDYRGDDVSGIAVHVAARVCGEAEGGQTLVSRTVRDLVAGDDLSCTAVGSRTLKGVPGRWSLFAVTPGRPAPSARPRRAPAARRPAARRDAVTVVLVDDHPLWRQTLKTVVESDGSARVVGEGDDGSAALPLVLELHPQVLLLDMDLPTVHGVDAAGQVREASPSTRVLALSASDDPQVVLAAVRAGAAGYLLKTAEAADIRAAVQRVAAGELVFPPSLSGVVLEGLRGTPDTRPAPPSPLTPRELDVLDLMAEGLSNQAIGARLHLSGKTVETHVGAIFVKLGIEPTDDVNRRVRAVVAHLSARAGRRR